MPQQIGYEVDWEDGVWESCFECVGSGQIEIYLGGEHEEFRMIDCSECDGKGFVIHEC